MFKLYKNPYAAEHIFVYSKLGDNWQYISIYSADKERYGRAATAYISQGPLTRLDNTIDYKIHKPTRAEQKLLLTTLFKGTK